MSDMAVALLRGINVGGKNILPMKALAEIFTAAGCTDVKTYIQSGNVAFRSGDAKAVAATVRDEIAAQFGLKVPVIVRSSAEMVRAINANPFVKRGVDADWMHVMFLADEPAKELVAGLDPLRATGAEEYVVKGREVYLHLPYGAAKTKLNNAHFDSKLKTVGTQRNWRTVMTLAGMMAM